MRCTCRAGETRLLKSMADDETKCKEDKGETGTTGYNATCRCAPSVCLHCRYSARRCLPPLLLPYTHLQTTTLKRRRGAGRPRVLPLLHLLEGVWQGAQAGRHRGHHQQVRAALFAVVCRSATGLGQTCTRKALKLGVAVYTHPHLHTPTRCNPLPPGRAWPSCCASPAPSQALRPPPSTSTSPACPRVRHTRLPVPLI